MYKLVRVCALLACAVTPAAGQTVSLPGTIQAENFAEGAAGVAYVDSTAGNAGQHYRTTDVDIEPAMDVGGGYNVGWVTPGEWLTFTVDVSAAGVYTLEFRVAAAGAGGTFHLESNGIDITGPVQIPDTGGWQSWATIARPAVNLAAGPQVWTLVVDAAGAPEVVGNFNYIRVASSAGATSTPFGEVAPALPGTLEVEDFDNGGEGVSYHDLTDTNEGGQYRATGVDLERTADGGGGYNVAWLMAGEWLNYSVNVSSAGTYDIEVRTASNGPGGTFHIEIDGEDRTGPFTVPDTRGWQNWTTIRKSAVSLEAGAQRWRVVVDSVGESGSAGNINFIRIGPSTNAPSAAGEGTDIVLWAQDVTTIAGNWVRAGSPGAASGEAMQSSDLGDGGIVDPQPDPTHYFEAEFRPDANRSYRLWLRMRASGDSKYNDSVWVQFSGAVHTTGAPLWPIGSSAALLVNLESCSGCGVSGWGWQNRAWWLADEAIVRFPTDDPQTIRIQTREDGVEIDQIVLSPSTYFHTPPGIQRDDTTILSRSDGSDLPNHAPTVALTSPSDGAAYTTPATLTVAANPADADGTIARVDFFAGTQPIGSATASPWSITWNDVPAGTYALTAVAHDDAGATTTSATVNVTVSAPPPPIATTLVFTASADHDTAMVTSYTVAIFREGDPSAGEFIAARELGKPAPSDGDITADITDLVSPLPNGSYYAIVTAAGPGGSSMSAPSATFIK